MATYLVGNAVLFEIVFRNADGQLFNPTGVTFSYRAKGWKAAISHYFGSSPMTRPTTGTYRLEMTLPEGIYETQWNSTGPDSSHPGETLTVTRSKVL